MINVNAELIDNVNELVNSRMGYAFMLAVIMGASMWVYSTESKETRQALNALTTEVRLLNQCFDKPTKVTYRLVIKEE